MTDQGQSGRPTAIEIYERVRQDARVELERQPPALAFSGLFAGFTLGATAVAYATVLDSLDGAAAATLVASLLYPIGYVGAIIGRAQLFTENTLYPVVLTFDDRRYLVGTARLWAIVLAANLVGALLFALIVAQSPALPGGVRDMVATLGHRSVAGTTWHTFWSAVLAGWLLALVAWLVEATDAAIGRLAVVWAITLVVGLLALDHSIASAVGTWTALLRGDVDAGPALGWEAMTILGNVFGGVLIVSLANYGQVRAGED